MATSTRHEKVLRLRAAEHALQRAIDYITEDLEATKDELRKLGEVPEDETDP